MWAWVPEQVVMRYVDDELPWYWRVPVRAGVILSPRLRHRVRLWRSLTNQLTELCGEKRPVGMPMRLRARRQYSAR
jgi:hypothetical protein